MQIKDVLEIMDKFDKKNIDEILFKTEGAELTRESTPELSGREYPISA
jgi:hypothetical protein